MREAKLRRLIADSNFPLELELHRLDCIACHQFMENFVFLLDQLCMPMVKIILAMVIGTGLFLTYTTTPIALTDALESLLRPLAKIKVPVHAFAMMMTIALRFIPTLIEEADKIMKAQMARGADFESGNLLQRAKAMVPLLVPLFVSAFRRAGDLAMAMEARGYQEGAETTRMYPLIYTATDKKAKVYMWTYCVGMSALMLVTGILF